MVRGETRDVGMMGYLLVSHNCLNLLQFRCGFNFLLRVAESFSHSNFTPHAQRASFFYYDGERQSFAGKPLNLSYESQGSDRQKLNMDPIP